MRAAAICSVSLAISLAILPACTSPAKRAELENPFSETSLERQLKIVVPLVEKAAGRRFLTPPVVAIATPEVLGRMLKEEEALIGGAVLRDTPPEVRERMVEENGPLASTDGLLGKYGIFEDVLLLCDTSIADATLGSGRSTEQISDVALVVMAHELTHALHDQHSDLERIVRGLPDQDALFAASATWEGLATWVSEGVARDLGLEDTWVFLASLQGWSPSGLEEKTAYSVWATYGRGRDAIAWHYDRGGFDEVWAVATTPPPSSSGMFRPERWAEPRPAPPIDYAAVLRGTEQSLTTGEWIVGISVLGEFELRGEAVVGDNEPEIETILAHLAHAWQMTGNRDDREGTVRILEFDGEEWPLRYLDALQRQQVADAALLASQVGREIEVETEPLEEIEADAALLRHSQVAGLGGTFAERHAAWVVRGNTAVVVTAQHFRPGLRLGWTVEEVFRRLDAARAGEPLPDPLPRR